MRDDAVSGPVIDAVGVTYYYEGRDDWVYALQDFNLRIERNEFLCILGPSGCGKSTFLSIVAGLRRPSEGRVFLNGREIEKPGLDRGIVFQEPALFAWLTAIQNVEFGLKMGGWSATRARERAAHVLDIVGLSTFTDFYPYQLSGGMKHRVALARAWALSDAAILLLDEPFSAIDAIGRAALQDYLMATWLAEPRTVLYITHDIEEACYLGDRVAIMSPSPGRVAFDQTIPLARPRDRHSAEFSAYERLLSDTMQDIIHSHASSHKSAEYPDSRVGSR